ncbi:MAG: class I SAM-dependent methyltransferase [Deltaproteobacteria bacterium]|nr:class I SAM-dependent methyltransferase [Deltaproteobacteria bacterium]
MNAAAPLADDWEQHWANYHSAAQLNPAHKYRRKLIVGAVQASRSHGERGADPLRIIDVGCGPGDVLCDLRRAFPYAELVGFDNSQGALSLAAARVTSLKVVRKDFSLPKMIPQDLTGWATHVVCSEVLEHLDKPEIVVGEIKKALAPGGRAIITVPGGPRTAFDIHIGHRRHYTPASLRDLLAPAGFASLDIFAAGFPFFNLYRLAVLVSGRHVAHAVGSDDGVSGLATAGMGLFSELFRLNFDRSRFGWQIFAIASA